MEKIITYEVRGNVVYWCCDDKCLIKETCKDNETALALLAQLNA